jgi:uncharacterized cupredoxin-like copper-binding protein
VKGLVAALSVTLLASVAVTIGAFRLDRAEGGESGVLDPGEIDVVLDIDYTRFTPSRLRVEEGTRVRFVLRNHDPIRHELIVGPEDVHARHADGTEAVHPPRPGEVTVEPNATASTTYRFDEAGAVIFACHLPGHNEYGMNGVIEVVAA